MSDDEAPVIESDAPEAEEPAPRKKRSKGTSPTARTLAECRRLGWVAGVVERHSPFPKPHGKKHDFLGVIDLIAVVPPTEEVECTARDEAGTICSSAENLGGSCCLQFEMEGEHRTVRHPGATLGIQACSDGRTGANGRGSDLAARRDKILAEPRARAWVEAGNRLEIWAWGSRVVGKGRRWRARVEVFTAESWSAPSTDLPPDLVPDALAVHQQRRPRIGGT